MTQLQIVATNPKLHDAAERLAQQLNLPLQLALDTNKTGLVVEFGAEGVCLASLDFPGYKPLRVDFTEGGAAHRRKFGGGNGQMIAKTVGIQGALRPQILDATAGLGGDGFVMACLGSEVKLLERSPVVHALLADGLERATLYAQASDPELLEILQRIQLLPADSIAYLEQTDGYCAQVIYLDPMFPERTKTAAVKKAMQLFHDLVGADMDDRRLLSAALPKAIFRVAVKRPRLAPMMSDAAPNLVLEGKSCRYDIYTHKKITLEALTETHQSF